MRAGAQRDAVPGDDRVSGRRGRGAGTLRQQAPGRAAKDEGANIDGVLNNDIVGGNKTPGDTLQNKNVVRVFSEGIPADGERNGAAA